MLLDFQTLFPGLSNIMDSVNRGWVGGRRVVGVGGELKVGSSMHLTGKAAILCPLKCTNSHSSLVRLIRSPAAV